MENSPSRLNAYLEKFRSYAVHGTEPFSKPTCIWRRLNVSSCKAIHLRIADFRVQTWETVSSREIILWKVFKRDRWSIADNGDRNARIERTKGCKRSVEGNQTWPMRVMAWRDKREREGGEGTTYGEFTYRYLRGPYSHTIRTHFEVCSALCIHRGV